VQISSDAVLDYFATFGRALDAVEVTDGSGVAMESRSGLVAAGKTVRETSTAGRVIYVIGNGGSAGIASQVTYALTHLSGLSSLGLNDPSALTGIGAEHGYDQVFSRQLAAYGRPGDHLIAISSSGQSANILNAVTAARAHGLGVLTLSGFKPDNPLRRMGDVNLYVDSREYGFVEVAHLALCHMVADVRS
jgi:D-sedoheptulose 7-phosphate isomerase